MAKKKTERPKKKRAEKPISYLNERGLTKKQQDFCIYYVETGNASESALRAGYSPKTAAHIAIENLHKQTIVDEIHRLSRPKEEETKNSIMTAQEVMELYSAVARGEVKDQFGLEASLSDRLKAMNELAKRTVDVENRLAGKADAKVEIALDWTRDESK